jgi:hypothetical protein
MASERQIAANRANAKRSTGPKTAAGKLRSSRNALKHGLSASGFLPMDDSARPLGYTIDRWPPDPIRDELTRAQTLISRVRCVRAELIVTVLRDPNASLIKQLAMLDRYERVALRTRKKAMRHF